MSVVPGQQLTVDVVVTNANPISGYQFGLGQLGVANSGFDPTKVNVVSIAEGPYLQDFATSHGGATTSPGPSTIQNSAGVVLPSGFVLQGTPIGQGPTGAGVVARITLVGVGVGYNPLTLSPPGLVSTVIDGFDSTQIVAAYPNANVQLQTTQVLVRQPFDVNGDGAVNISDFALVGSLWLQTGAPYFSPADVNGDGAVNIVDLAAIGAHYLEVYQY